MRPADRGRGLIRPLAGDGPARLLMVHPGAIPVEHHRALADGLPAGHAMLVADLEQVPAYFQAALTGGPARTTITAIAQEVAAALRALPPVPGPWTLAGWSFGGVVAHALLAELDPAERPARVVVLDALAPVPDYTAAEDDELDPRVVLGWFAMYLAAKRGGTVDVDAALLRTLAFDDGLERVLAAAVAGGALRPGTPVVGLAKVFDAYREGLLRNNKLVHGHAPRRTDVPFTLVRPERGLVDRPGALGWEQVTDAPQVLGCPGDHYTMLRAPEAVRQFAGLVAPAARPALSV